MAIGYLRSGELDMALGGGANGNTTPEVRALLQDRLGDGTADLGEGTFILALTTEERALEAGLPIYGFVAEAPATGEVTAVDCGAAADGPHYLGAAGALALVRALHGRDRETVVSCGDPRLGAPATVTVTPNVPGGVETMMPAQFLDLEEYAPGEPNVLAREVATLAPFPLEPVRSALDFVPQDTVILTDRPELLHSLADRLGEALVVSTAQTVTPEAVAETIAAWGRPIRHIRVVADLGASAPPPALPVGGDGVTHRAPRSRVPDPAVRVRAPLRGGHLAPRAVPRRRARRRAAPARRALLGAVEERALELPKCLVHGVFTTERDVAAGVRQAEAETSAKHFLRSRSTTTACARRRSSRRSPASCPRTLRRGSTPRPSSSRSAAHAGSRPS